MGVLRDKSKKEASGWDGRGVSHRHLPNQTQLSGVCVTVCTCVCVCARVFGERKKERKDYGNTSSLAHSNRGKHHKALACTTHTHTPACTHTHTQSHKPSVPLLLLFSPFHQGLHPARAAKKRGVEPR